MPDLHGFCIQFSGRTVIMIKKNFILRSQYDGLGVSVLATFPESKPLAVLQLAHGMCGCKERFLPFMTFLSEHGVICVANDHRGHGESVLKPEERGYMYSGGYVALVEDMKVLTDRMHSDYPDLPVFILGHSMGSLAVRTYMKSYDDAVSGVILCGSPSRNPMSSAGLVLSRLLSLFNGGRMRVGVIQRLTSWSYNRRFAGEGYNAWTCSDVSVRKESAANPSCTFDFTANAMYALMAMMKETYSDAGWKVGNPGMPIYFISGGDDPCMRNEGSFHASVQHLAGLGYRDVTSVIYPGMRHEVLNETGKEEVWNDILVHLRSWL